MLTFHLLLMFQAAPEGLESRFASLEGSGVEAELALLKQGALQDRSRQKLLTDAIDWNRTTIDQEIDDIRRRRR